MTGIVVRGDAFVFAEAVEKHHPDPFASVTRDAFLTQAERAEALAASGNSSSSMVELMRLGALLGERNGHSGIFSLDSHAAPLRAYPIWPYEFDDGVFVVAGAGRQLAGCELLAVGGVPIDELNRAVTALIPHDNAWTIRARRPTFLVNADVLYGLGIIEAVERATFRLGAPGGATHELELEPLPAPEYRRRLGTGEYLPRRRMPSYVRRRDEARWFEPVGAGRALHVAYNVTRGETATFASEVEALAEPRRVELIVLDLRHNGGGDNRAYGPLLDALERLVRERGKRLAVLTSRATFSAAMQLVVDVEQRMPGLFVGEPTGGSPNQYGDAATVALPASGLTAHIATIAWMTAGASDQRVTRQPDVSAPLVSSAFFGGDDPVLATALGCLA